MRETKEQRIQRSFSNLQRFGETDSSELEWLLDELNKARAVMRSCLRAAVLDGRPTLQLQDRLRAALGIDHEGKEIEHAAE